MWVYINCGIIIIIIFCVSYFCSFFIYQMNNKSKQCREAAEEAGKDN